METKSLKPKVGDCIRYKYKGGYEYSRWSDIHGSHTLMGEEPRGLPIYNKQSQVVGYHPEPMECLEGVWIKDNFAGRRWMVRLTPKSNVWRPYKGKVVKATIQAKPLDHQPLGDTRTLVITVQIEGCSQHMLRLHAQNFCTKLENSLDAYTHEDACPDSFTYRTPTFCIIKGEPHHVYKALGNRHIT